MVGKTNADSAIDPAIALNLVVTGFNGAYDGSSHTITATVAEEYQSATTFRYSTNGTSWSATKPTRTNAGTTTVYVRATHSTLGTVEANTTIKITPAPVTLTAGSLNTKYNKYGNAQTVNTYTCNVSGVYFPSTVKAYGSGTNVGTYSVTFSGVTLNETTDTTGNYAVTRTVNGTITITKANADDLGLRVWDYSGNYDGSAHTVTASVSVTSGTTIQYSTNNSTWSTTAPTRTSVGSTTVYVRAVNSNFNTATAQGTITIIEAKATLIVSWANGVYCSLFDPAGNAVFSANTSGYWTGNPTMTGEYRAICVNTDPMTRTVNVTSTTSGTYYIAW